MSAISRESSYYSAAAMSRPKFLVYHGPLEPNSDKKSPNWPFDLDEEDLET